MKRVLILYLCLALLLFTACSSKAETDDIQTAVSTEAPTIEPTDSSANFEESESDATFISVSVPLTTDITHADDTTELFSYSYINMLVIYTNLFIIIFPTF